MTIRRNQSGRTLAHIFMVMMAAAIFSALAVPGVARQASAAAPRQGVGPCPRSQALPRFRPDADVGATYAVSGDTATYRFYSFTDRNPVNGVPGLIAYCVYPPSPPATANAQARGADGAPWTADVGFDNFAFRRPDGNPSNIPLDGGGATRMGTATWSGQPAPRQQVILLHINDPAMCARIYGDSPRTCFVRPANNPGQPVCDRGTSTIAYNAMPVDVVDCYRATLGFEANQVNEFGDGVALAGTSRSLGTLQVMFASYACQSGTWTAGNCSSAPGATFQHPITASLYALNNLTTPIARVTRTVTFPYRPSADPTNCPGNPAQWYNPARGACANSIGKVVTFRFGGQTLPDQVVWTVAFNTTHSGYHPIGESATCFHESGGCPYDSLNVGATSFTGAPYAGIDLDEDIAYLSIGSPAGPLGPSSGWTGFRPLGAITTGLAGQTPRPVLDPARANRTPVLPRPRHRAVKLQKA